MPPTIPSRTMPTCTSGRRGTTTLALSVLTIVKTWSTYVLNSCRVALDLRRFNHRHDSVLETLYQSIKEHLPVAASSVADIPGSNYAFPCHIVATDTRPDIVVWNDTTRETCLTVCFDTPFVQAITQKVDRYQELSEAMQAVGYKTNLVTVERDRVQSSCT